MKATPVALSSLHAQTNVESVWGSNVLVYNYRLLRMVPRLYRQALSSLATHRLKKALLCSPRAGLPPATRRLLSSASGKETAEELHGPSERDS